MKPALNNFFFFTREISISVMAKENNPELKRILERANRRCGSKRNSLDNIEFKRI